MKKLFLFYYNFIENNLHLYRIKKYLISNVTLKKPVIFDVGCHAGKVTSLLKNLYSDALIYCFEPNKKLVKKFKITSKKIKIFNLALGNKIEKKLFYFNEIDLTSTLTNYNRDSLYLKLKNILFNNSVKKPNQTVNVTTLDNFCKKNKIKKIDFLKIDVEGYEYLVLQGGKEILKKVKYLMIEIQRNDMYKSYSKSKIENYLKKNQFKLIKSFSFPLMLFQDRIYKNINF